MMISAHNTSLIFENKSSGFGSKIGVFVSQKQIFYSHQIQCSNVDAVSQRFL